MTFKQFKQSLLDYEPLSLVGCSYCGADPKNPTWQELCKLFECINCQCDLLAEGLWTGYGWQYLSILIKKHPDDTKLKVIFKALFKKGM